MKIIKNKDNYVFEFESELNNITISGCDIFTAKQNILNYISGLIDIEIEYRMFFERGVNHN